MSIYSGCLYIVAALILTDIKKTCKLIVKYMYFNLFNHKKNNMYCQQMLHFFYNSVNP